MPPYAGVVELADARDSKSRVRKDVRVRPPPPAPKNQHFRQEVLVFAYFIFETLKTGRHSLCLPALWSLKFRLRLGENGAHVGHFFAERERDGLAVVGEPVGFAALALAQQIGEQER